MDNCAPICGMFSNITDSIDGVREDLRDIASCVRDLTEALQALSGTHTGSEKIVELEGRIEQILGQVDAGITRAEALKGAARASEERERGHMKRAEAALELARGNDDGEKTDSFEEAVRAYHDVVEGDAGSGESNGVSTVPDGLEGDGDGRAWAKAQKRR